MNTQVTFSAPKIRARVNEVRFVANENAVKCFLTVEMNWNKDPYCKLMRACEPLGIKSYFNGILSLEKATADPYIATNLEDYTYTGFVRLKDGDESDIEAAKSVAYKKAYRQFIGYYITNYSKLYTRLTAYAEDVWEDQIAQLIERYEDVDREIVEITSD